MQSPALQRALGEQIQRRNRDRLLEIASWAPWLSQCSCTWGEDATALVRAISPLAIGERAARREFERESEALSELSLAARRLAAGRAHLFLGADFPVFEVDAGTAVEHIAELWRDGGRSDLWLFAAGGGQGVAIEAYGDHRCLVFSVSSWG